MSLVGTLAKVAMGVVAARGIGKVFGGSRAGGGLAGALGSMLGGGSQTGGSGLGGLAGALGGLLGGSQGGSGGGLGGLLNSLGGGAQASAPAAGSGGGLGGMLNEVFQGKNPAQINATPDEEEQAKLLLRAMIDAAKADGQIDEEEQRKITEHLGDVSPEELEFVRREMQAPLDVQGLVNSVPRGMEQQVYLMSLLAIDLDSQPEAQYLDQLAKGLGLSPETVNAIHQQAGAPALYS